MNTESGGDSDQKEKLRNVTRARHNHMNSCGFDVLILALIFDLENYILHSS